MIIKVCGMREWSNIQQVTPLDINWMGFIFYPKSPRFVSDEYTLPDPFPSHIKKVGVFVNATEEEMLEKVNRYKLDYLQLHGSESPDVCYSLQKRGIQIIKVFSVATEEDLEKTSLYEGRADYFLFDTKCKEYGGSGKMFDWSVLNAYTGKTPFLLSGGIQPASVNAVTDFQHPRMVGIDLNSGFEIAPALKDEKALYEFIQQVRK